MKPLFRADRTLFVYTPLILPYYGSHAKKRLNEFLLRMQIRLLQKSLGFENPIVWIENPVGISVAKYLNPALIIYYRIDKFECHHELRNPEEIIKLDEKVTREADLILCVSSKLYEEKLKLKKEGVYYVPHGVDFDHFHQAEEDLPLPEDMKDIRHPIVGYFGSLDAKNDDSIIQYCATHRPDISFVLVGEKEGRNRLLEGLPNVHFLGFKEYEQLPRYGRNFDVCIMFWKVNEWIEHSNPVKTMEYLAMGKPIVSVAFHEILRKYDGLIATAHTPEEFLKKMGEEIANDSGERRRARLDFVRDQTWQARVEYISHLVAECFRSSV